MLASSKVFNVVITFFFLPESKVLLEELNNALSISEGLLIDFVDFVHGVLKGAFSELACLLAVLHNFVVENGEVEGESELDRIACWKISANGVSLLVAGEGDLSCLL